MSRTRDTDYLTVSTRIRAMENRLLTRERLERMIEARDAAEARKLLAECGYADGVELEQALAQALRTPSGIWRAPSRTLACSRCSK